MKQTQKVKNAAIVILGASGDLARRKLVPALARLYERGEIDNTSIVIGSGRTEYSDEAFRQRFDVSPDFSANLYYHARISGLRRFIEKRGRFEKIIFFLALPPSVYGSTAAELAKEGFGEKSLLIIEKPFGYDLASAKNLNQALTDSFQEKQVFRIDHYLAKEAVQNILVFRFANYLFGPLWNKDHIESIQINAFEEIGVEDRGAYFDGAGIIRDMVQNHLTQLLSLVTMEAPESLAAEDIRKRKIEVLNNLCIADCCRAQYAGYLSEKGVRPDSKTETYAEIKLFIDHERWAGMPVYIRTGKACGRKGTEIGVTFKHVPEGLFNQNGKLPPNRIIFKIQPSEGIVVDLSSKIPGWDVAIKETNMAFCYNKSFENEIPEAYQKLLLDALKCDRTLFVSAEETELSWKKYEPVLDKGPVRVYEKGNPPAPCLAADWIDFGKYATVC